MDTTHTDTCTIFTRPRTPRLPLAPADPPSLADSGDSQGSFRPQLEQAIQIVFKECSKPKKKYRLRAHRALVSLLTSAHKYRSAASDDGLVVWPWGFVRRAGAHFMHRLG